MSVIPGFVRSATVYETVVVVLLPAWSTAVTVNVFVPRVAVSIGEPSSTVPLQVAMPVPPVSSVHAKSASMLAPCV
ncbi:hypothetical protein [Paraconexibacter algicola]|uniref:Uncharacterized protein n=1 Tax=Paraconexibacter algicola TaxID=2133960 RepID=A0A2T4UKE0_9ACTN|nr:hypothetical protein [Paraconexibacter algicola]PTL59658.1 hypothetical protein C7Y72_08345 [Paraconexibacter algicola]